MQHVSLMKRQMFLAGTSVGCALDRACRRNWRAGNRRSRPQVMRVRRSSCWRRPKQTILKQESDVCAGMLKQVGINVDSQAMDRGTVMQRRAMMDPPEKGGRNLFITGWSGLDQSKPVGHVFLRGNGKSAMFGWPDAPKIDALRRRRLVAPDLAAQQKLAVELQLQAFTDVPYTLAILSGDGLSQAHHLPAERLRQVRNVRRC
jgi:hypothetical protein